MKTASKRKQAAERIPTAEFAMKLIAAEDFETFYAENVSQMQALTLSQYLQELCEQKGIKQHELICSIDIDRIYGHKIFSGERNPSRDYVLKLAVGMQLTIDEAQRLLIISKNSPLYARVPRDAALLHCLHSKAGYEKTQENLHKWGMTTLGEQR